jgi:hypothetical protein
MNMQVTGAAGFFGVLVYSTGLVTMIFWIVVGWRAMRAHEELADAVRQLSERR